MAEDIEVRVKGDRTGESVPRDPLTATSGIMALHEIVRGRADTADCHIQTA